MKRPEHDAQDSLDSAATPSPRTTIVGGRPPERTDLAQIVPTGLQRLLRLAALDATFRDELIRRRGAAAKAAGVPLTPSESAVLAAIPAERLEQMVGSLPPPAPGRREFLRQTAATAVVLLGGAALGSTQIGCPLAAGGARPDMPPPPEDQDADAGGEAQPEQDHPVTRGISIDVPPERPDQSEMMTGGGAAPDLPPDRQP
ncbi:MAG: hypothetical protein HY905_05845 [Deltaproteobacteria bacterium]|nr:hypothetical protein [Deltaproteobacteria bacterium]